jgi:DNA-binding CsgD family transcriptional regulator
MSAYVREPRRIVTDAERRAMLHWADQRAKLTNKAIARTLGLAENTVAKVIWQERSQRRARG